MLLGEFSPIEEGHHLLKIEKIAPTEKDQVTWINQFIFVNVGLVEANEDYLKGVLSIKIVSFLMAAILGYFAFRKIDSGSSSIFRLRLVFIFLLLNLQPFLLLDPTLYQEYFIVHQLTFALYYSFLVHYWMAELHSFVFHVMSSPRTTADQDEELQVPSLVPKILTAVRNLKSPHNLRFFSPPTSLETLWFQLLSSGSRFWCAGSTCSMLSWLFPRTGTLWQQGPKPSFRSLSSSWLQLESNYLYFPTCSHRISC